MVNKKEYGKTFEFDKEYFINPIIYDDIILHQLGEVCCEVGYSVKQHIQVCHEITYIISGNGEIACGNKILTVGNADIILNYFGESHSIKANLDNKLRYAYLGFTFNEQSNNELIKTLSSFYSSKVKQNIKNDDYKLQFLFTNLLDEFYTNKEFSREVVKTYLLQILIYVYRLMNNKIEKSDTRKINISESFETGKTVYAVIKYIENNLLKIKNLTEIADELGYSYNYLSHLFKSKMSISIQNYINNEKIELSKKLIKENNMSITEVANILNYQTVQAYSKAFKKNCKISPREYKQLE